MCMWQACASCIIVAMRLCRCICSCVASCTMFVFYGVHRVQHLGGAPPRSLFVGCAFICAKIGCPGVCSIREEMVSCVFRRRGTFIVFSIVCACAVARCGPRNHRHGITGYPARVKPERHWHAVSVSKFCPNCR